MTCARPAPSAIRIPISFVRCETRYPTTPYTPMAASISATVPKIPSSSVGKLRNPIERPITSSMLRTDVTA